MKEDKGNKPASCNTAVARHNLMEITDYALHKTWYIIDFGNAELKASVSCTFHKLLYQVSPKV